MKKIEDILNKLDLVYYEYDLKKQILFLDKNSNKKYYSMELTKITFYLSKNNIKFYVNNDKDIFLNKENQFIVFLKKIYEYIFLKIKNINHDIYILNDKKIKGAKNLPLFDIKHLKTNIDFSLYDALIFTSKNAIISINKTNKLWRNLPSYVIAAQSAKVLKQCAGKLKFLSKTHHGDEFAHEIKNELLNKKVLYLRGDKTVSNICSILNKHGVSCEEIIVYENKKIVYKHIDFKKNSTFIFSSPSSISYFLDNFEWKNTFKAVCIGKTTAKYLPSYIKKEIALVTSLESCVKKAYSLNN